MMIGIDDNQNLVYEGRTTWGHALWPAPFLSPATIKSDTDPQLTPPRFHNLQALPFILFREDAYDPVSRVRRGRFYQAGQSQPMTWQTYPHPAKPQRPENKSTGTIPKSLLTFQSFLLANEYRNVGTHQLLVVLGSEESFSIWAVLGFERIATGEEIVTLKARQGIGALPRLDHNAIPEAGRAKVRAALDKLTEDIYRAGPESVADRAREAAAVILSIFLHDGPEPGPVIELGKAISKLVDRGEDEKNSVLVHAAHISRLSHSRGKASVQDKFQTRPLREQDAELAVQCVGTILCELGWADWV